MSDELDMGLDERLNLLESLVSGDLLLSGKINKFVDVTLIGVLLDDWSSVDNVLEDCCFHNFTILDLWLSDQSNGHFWKLLDLLDNGKSSVGLGGLKSDLDELLEFLEGLSSPHGLDGNISSLLSDSNNCWLLDEGNLLALVDSGGKGWRANNLKRPSFVGFLHNVEVRFLLLFDLLIESLKLAFVSNALNNSLSVSHDDGNSCWLHDSPVRLTFLLDDWLGKDLDFVGKSGDGFEDERGLG